MRNIALFLTLVIALAAGSGCATPYTLRMTAVREPYDSSSLSPKLKTKNYQKIMIMPPSGTKRGEFDSMIALCEKVFIRKGITPINGGITGRVVLRVPDESGKEKNEGAQDLSDVERAFIMAKESGCDAILQIGTFQVSGPVYTRFFIAERKTDTPFFTEVSEEEYQAWQQYKRTFASKWITFVGRLSDVETGEVLASINVASAPNWNMPADYEETLSNGSYLVKQSYTYDSHYFDGHKWVQLDGPWASKAHERAVQAILEKVAENIVGK